VSESLKTVAANTRQTWSETDSYTLERYEEFCGFLADGQSVLDIGCNTGRGGALLRQRFPNAVLCGLDLIASRIAQIPAGTYDELVCTDIATWSTTRRFDRIVAGEVIEHIPPDMFGPMLSKCRSLLSDGGLIVFTTPNPRSLLVRLGRRAVFRDASHVNIVTPAELRTAAASAGLELVAVHGSGKATRLFGRVPLLTLYGSYLAVLKADARPVGDLHRTEERH
jgi:predicted TPR repeat methyltransferase